MLELLSNLMQLLLTGVTVLIALPALLLLLQVVLAVLPARGRSEPAGMARPRIAIVMPAHNESTGLLPAIAAAQAQLLPGDRLLVVADNCNDDTAAVARAAGAEVTERFNTTLRGKGYALDHGVRQLRSDPPEVMVVLDADCMAEPGSLLRIASLSHATGRPVQATYLMTAANTGMKMRVAEFAMRVKNRVRPRGMHRLGWPCGLYGTGMAFPWAVADTAPLASGHLAEDMQLGVRLAEQGTPPLFCEDARVLSVFAGSKAGEQSQRTRWEHGHLSLMLSDGPRLVLNALKRGRLALLMQVLDMLVPPLALLAMVTLALGALNLLVWAVFGWQAPLMASFAGFLGLAVAILLARARFAADLLSGRELLMAPVYMLAKIPLYLRFLVKRQVEWVRTQRDGQAEGTPDQPAHADGIHRINVDGLPFVASTVDALSAHICQQAAAGRGGWVVTPNIDILRRWRQDADFRALVHDADIFTADGKPIVWASRLQGTPLPTRLTGSDLFVALFERAARAGLRLALIGGNPGTAEQAAQRLAAQAGVPPAAVARAHCPPLGFERMPEEMRSMQQLLADWQPHIVFVGLGSPKQEQLIHQLRARHPSAWYLGVGVSFSFVVGDVKRAPAWAQKAGLEWLHRLLQEPKRLGRRYLVDGLPFAFGLLARALLRRLTGRVA